MALTYLIIAHLIGDFVFQPVRLVDWKIKSMKGLSVHAFIIFILSFIALFSSPKLEYLSSILIALLIGFTHFLIDEIKIIYNSRGKAKLTAFTIDQLVHIAVILTIYFFIIEKL